MNDFVVVLRLHNGDDVIGILVDDKDGVVKIYNPYFVRVSTTNNIVVLPYCYLTDEKYFEFRKTDTMFIVSASESVTTRYFEIMDNSDEDPFEAPDKNYVKGNDTKH